MSKNTHFLRIERESETESSFTGYLEKLWTDPDEFFGQILHLCDTLRCTGHLVQTEEQRMTKKADGLMKQVMNRNSSWKFAVKAGGRVKMLFRFQSQDDHKLSYQKDDVMTVIDPQWKIDQDFTWALCENSDGKLGLAVFNDMECVSNPPQQESRSGYPCRANKNFMKNRPWELALEEGKMYTLLWKPTRNWWEVLASGEASASQENGFSPRTHFDVDEKYNLYDTLDGDDGVPAPPSTDEEHMNKNEEIQRSDSYKYHYEEPDVKEMTDSEGIYESLLSLRESSTEHDEEHLKGRMMNPQDERKSEDNNNISQFMLPNPERKGIHMMRLVEEGRYQNESPSYSPQPGIYESVSDLRKSSTEDHERHFEGEYDELTTQKEK
uniref:SH3 domain-containing protein n=1 Tax=Eptatretus burgeri TaxID=7764 RepID=A0A8C4PYS5_EPTBU